MASPPRAAGKQVEIYDPATGVFSPRGATVNARNNPAALLLPGDKILLIGGFWSTVMFHDSIEVYDPATGQTQITGHFSGPRAAVAGVALADGHILAAGGFIDAQLTGTAHADQIDPVTGQASPVASLRAPRFEAIPILLRDGRALIVGGLNSTGVLKNAEVYVP